MKTTKYYKFFFSIYSLSERARLMKERALMSEEEINISNMDINDDLDSYSDEEGDLCIDIGKIYYD